MSTARENILGRVKSALAPLTKRSPLPEWNSSLAERINTAIPEKPLTAMNAPGVGGAVADPRARSVVAGDALTGAAPVREDPERLISLNAGLADLTAQASGSQMGGAVVGDWALFSERLQQLHGIPLAGEAALADWLARQGWTHGYCAPELWMRFERWLPTPHFHVETTFDRARLNDYQFGITRASGAIAETGSVVLTDEDTPSRLGALAPWVHIAVLKRDQILPTVAAALAAMPADPNIIWVSGPSKTADVEGILIEGVHGPGQQIALLVG